MKAYEVIKSLCDSRGIPVTVLEAQLGFSRGSIGKMKNAQDAKSDRIKIIADYFGVSPEYILTGEIQDETGRYFFDEETAAVAQELHDRPELSMMFKALRKASPESLRLVAEESGKNEPVLHRWKVVIGQMYEFAVRNELLPQEKRDMIRYIDISFSSNPNKLTRTNFSREEIEILWKHSENRAVKSILLLLYTGLRISEFLALKKEDVDLQRRVFKVTASKTSAGVREVPIAEKTVHLWEYLLALPGKEVFPAERGKKYIYQNYLAYIWQPVMKTLGFSHTIHETRHTCISLLTEAGVDARLIKQIVGHASQDVTEGIYTHLAFEKKKAAIDNL